ncbi:MAG TPA: hypothetical protein VJT31_20970, partial [Rugosimonospora sp.]|nr:hypothetical protein [Rugosimonospora sp.]
EAFTRAAESLRESSEPGQLQDALWAYDVAGGKLSGLNITDLVPPPVPAPPADVPRSATDEQASSLVARLLGPEAGAPAADPSLDYQSFRIADSKLLKEFWEKAQKDYAVLVGNEDSGREAAWRELVKFLRRSVHGPRFEIERPAGSYCAAFNTNRWVLEFDLRTSRPDDGTARLAHELTHVEIATIIGRRLGAATDDPLVMKRIFENWDVWGPLWAKALERRDPRYPAATRLLESFISDNEVNALIQQSRGHYKARWRRARAELRRAGTINGFDRMVLDRLRRRLAEASRLILDRRARYYHLMGEALAFRVQRLLESLGSVRDWSGSVRLLSIPGYRVAVSLAGVSLWPKSSPRLDGSPRLAHADRPLYSVQVSDVNQAGAVLRRESQKFAANAMVEFVTKGPVDAAVAVELAGSVGKDQVLVLAGSRVDLADGRLADHFVPYTWWHERTLDLESFDGYYTVHVTEQTPDLAMTGLPRMRNLGGGVFELSAYWHLVHRHRRGIVVRPADLLGADPVAVYGKVGMPQVLAGLPGRITPWAVAQTARALAGFLLERSEVAAGPLWVQVHHEETEPPKIYAEVPVELSRAVDERDTLTLEFVFGGVDASAYAFESTGADPSIDVHLLSDALLSVAGGELSMPALERAGVLAALAERLRVTPRELLPVAYLAARVYGIGGLTEARLVQAAALLRAWRGQGEPLEVTEESLPAIVATVTGKSGIRAQTQQFAALAGMLESSRET